MPAPCRPLRVATPSMPMCCMTVCTIPTNLARFLGSTSSGGADSADPSVSGGSRVFCAAARRLARAARRRSAARRTGAGRSRRAPARRRRSGRLIGRDRAAVPPSPSSPRRNSPSGHSAVVGPLSSRRSIAARACSSSSSNRGRCSTGIASRTAAVRCGHRCGRVVVLGVHDDRRAPGRDARPARCHRGRSARTGPRRGGARSRRPRPRSAATGRAARPASSAARRAPRRRAAARPALAPAHWSTATHLPATTATGRRRTPLAGFVHVHADRAEVVAVQPEVVLPVGDAVLDAFVDVRQQRRRRRGPSRSTSCSSRLRASIAGLAAVVPMVDDLGPRLGGEHSAGGALAASHLGMQPGDDLEHERRRQLLGRLVGRDQRPQPRVEEAVDEAYVQCFERRAQLGEHPAHALRHRRRDDVLHDRGAARRHVRAVERPFGPHPGASHATLDRRGHGASPSPR